LIGIGDDRSLSENRNKPLKNKQNPIANYRYQSLASGSV